MGLLSDIKVIVAVAVLIAFAALGAAYSIEKAKRKAAEAELAAAQATIATQQGAIQAHQQNTAAIHTSANVQQVIAQQAAPIHQAIEDSTPETKLNEAQKRIADCILALYRGLLKGGSCSDTSAGSVLPKATEASPGGTKDR